MGSLLTPLKRDTMLRRRRNEKEHFYYSADVLHGIMQWLGDSARTIHSPNAVPTPNEYAFCLYRDASGDWCCQHNVDTSTGYVDQYLIPHRHIYIYVAGIRHTDHHTNKQAEWTSDFCGNPRLQHKH
jgi:hypothetical protein